MNLREIFGRVNSFFHKPERDRELDAEMQAHLGTNSDFVVEAWEPPLAVALWHSHP